MALPKLPTVQARRAAARALCPRGWQAYEQQAARAAAAQDRARATEAELATRSAEVQALQARPPIKLSCCSGYFADMFDSTEPLGSHTWHQCACHGCILSSAGSAEHVSVQQQYVCGRQAP